MSTFEQEHLQYNLHHSESSFTKANQLLRLQPPSHGQKDPGYKDAPTTNLWRKKQRRENNTNFIPILIFQTMVHIHLYWITPPVLASKKPKQQGKPCCISRNQTTAYLLQWSKPPPPWKVLQSWKGHALTIFYLYQYIY